MLFLFAAVDATSLLVPAFRERGFELRTIC
jgi:hypothetical protein